MISLQESKRIRQAIREEIYSRGIGAEFKTKDIRAALLAKDMDVDPHAITSMVRRECERSLKKTHKDGHDGYTYRICRIPKDMKEEEE